MGYGFGYINDLAARIHNNAINHGFWEADGNDSGFNITDRRSHWQTAQKLALIHSEVSEALEADRKEDPDNLGEELADIIIRTLDLAEKQQLNIEQIILNKMEQNESRPWMHGKAY